MASYTQKTDHGRRPRHMVLLDDLESVARKWAAVSSSSSSSSPSPRHHGDGDDSWSGGGGTGGSGWTLAQDADLALFLEEFSLHIQRRAAEVARSAGQLDDKLRRASAAVHAANLQFSCLTNERFVEQVVVVTNEEEEEAEIWDENDDKSRKAVKVDPNNSDDEDDDNDDDDATTEREEGAAIADGLKALSIFYDPAAAATSDGGGMQGGYGAPDADHYFGLDGEDDSCYYYESNPADVYNHRPLPFVVGSREFLESTDAGLGGEDEVEEHRPFE